MAPVHGPCFAVSQCQLLPGAPMRRGGLSVLSPSIYLCVCVWMCVSSKNTAVCCLTARKSPRNSSLPLGLAIYILRKMPRKPDESSVECYGLIAARPPRGIEHYGNWVCRPTTSLRERWRKCGSPSIRLRNREPSSMQIGSPSKRQELGCGTESRSIPVQSKPTTC